MILLYLFHKRARLLNTSSVRNVLTKRLSYGKYGKPFTTDKIIEVTNKINRLNLRNIPLKQNVTVEMIQEYVNKLIKWCASQKSEHCRCSLFLKLFSHFYFFH